MSRRFRCVRSLVGQLLPFAASLVTGVLGLEAVRQLNEGNALKDLIKKYTEVQVVDGPMPAEVPRSGVPLADREHDMRS